MDKQIIIQVQDDNSDIRIVKQTVIFDENTGEIKTDSKVVKFADLSDEIKNNINYLISTFFE